MEQVVENSLKGVLKNNSFRMIMHLFEETLREM
jgi:hypothetical protein